MQEMNMMKSMMRSTAIAALLSLPVATGAAYAQQAQEPQQSQQQSQGTQQPATSSQQGATGQQPDAGGQADADQQADALVATVGGVEIHGSDVMTTIGMLPPQLQSQPPQMLVPLALQHLIVRELILEEARAENLAEDPEVVALVEGAARGAEEDAMVQVWIDREMADVVSDEAVQQVYDNLEPKGQDVVLPLEEMRPQIEQYLRQQAMQGIQDRLQQDAEIVLYDPSGEPIPQQ